MMKLSRLLQQSRAWFQILETGSYDAVRMLHMNCFGKSYDVRDSSRMHAFTFRAGISTAIKDYSVKERVFAPYSVYKGKAALSFEPVMPTFSKLDSGNLKVERHGVMLLTFIPAIGERKYGYEKKQHFALSATEMGSVISLGPTDSSEFFHDPSMKSSNAGQVRKSLSIKPQPDGSGGYFISLSVVNNILKTNDRFNVPLTAGEFTVLKTACSFVLPHIMGWDRLTGKSPKDMAARPSVADRQLPNLEWDR